jgi:plastocyanin
VNGSTENTVYLTDSGFLPSEITIEQGETVTWINNDSSSMWVATDEHPSHTNYAGSQLYQHCSSGDQTEAAFDQCSSGDRFSFSFEKTGEWDYHNHDNAGQTGTVIVE